jgi:hypothetical protein
VYEEAVNPESTDKQSGTQRVPAPRYGPFGGARSGGDAAKKIGSPGAGLKSWQMTFFPKPLIAGKDEDRKTAS